MAAPPKTLDALRREIDAADQALVELLARRFRIVDQVLAVKRQEGLPALIPERVEVVIAQVRNLANTAGVSPEIAERLWRLLIAETIAYEEKHLK